MSPSMQHARREATPPPSAAGRRSAEEILGAVARSQWFAQRRSAQLKVSLLKLARLTIEPAAAESDQDSNDNDNSNSNSNSSNTISSSNSNGNSSSPPNNNSSLLSASPDLVKVLGGDCNRRSISSIGSIIELDFTGLAVGTLKNPYYTPSYLDLMVDDDPTGAQYQLQEAATNTPGCSGAVDSTLSEREHPLLQAAAEGNMEQLAKMILEDKVDVNVRSIKDRSTALHKATYYNRLEAVKFLVNHGASLDATNNLGSMPLHIAAALGYQGVLRILAHAGCKLDVRDRYGNTPLCLAVRSAHRARHNNNDNNNNSSPALPNCCTRDWHPYSATDIVHDCILADLLIFGAAIDFKRSDGRTCVHIACETGDLSALRFLATKGAKINIRDEAGQLPIFVAINSGRVEVVKYLLDKFPECVDFIFKARDNSGRNVIHIAVAAIAACQQASARSPAHSGASISMQVERRIQILEYMVNHLKRANMSNTCTMMNETDLITGSTPLHLAVTSRSALAVDSLVRTGKGVMDVNALNKKGDTALHLCMSHEENDHFSMAITMAIARRLLEAGAKPGIKNKAKLTAEMMLRRKIQMQREKNGISPNKNELRWLSFERMLVAWLKTCNEQQQQRI